MSTKETPDVESPLGTRPNPFAPTTVTVCGKCGHEARAEVTLHPLVCPNCHTAYAAAQPARNAEYEHRMWALANVRRSEVARCAEHPGYTDGCVACAYDLGRATGQVEAGAYWTHEEAMQRCAAPTPEATAPTFDPCDCDGEGCAHAPAGLPPRQQRARQRPPEHRSRPGQNAVAGAKPGQAAFDAVHALRDQLRD